MRRPGQPNVVLINCDDLGYGDLGCYGSQAQRHAGARPHGCRGGPVHRLLHGLAGVLAVACRAAHRLLPTADRLRLLRRAPGAVPRATAWAPPRRGDDRSAVLARRRLRDQAVGKWHCGDQPPFLPDPPRLRQLLRHPVQQRHGTAGAAGGRRPLPELLAQFETALPVDEYPPLPLVLDEEVIEAQPDQASLTARFVDESVRFMRPTATGRGSSTWRTSTSTSRIYVQERFARASRNGRYGAAVATIDWADRRAARRAARLGLDEDTLVIFTSDNGSRAAGEGGSNAPLRGEKGTTWEGGMRVPCIVRWPGRIAQGTVCTALATSMDLLPTLAALAGAVPLFRPTTDRRPRHLGAPRSETASLTSRRRSSTTGATTWRRFGPVDGSSTSRSRASPSPSCMTSMTTWARRPTATPNRRTSSRAPRHADRARAELGDARLGIDGCGVRPAGEVATPRPLTTFDADHPYYMAEYDLMERG